MSKQEVRKSVAQHIIIKFLLKEGTKSAEILRRLCAQFGEETLSKTQVYEWRKKIVAGREAVESKPTKGDRGQASLQTTFLPYVTLLQKISA